MSKGKTKNYADLLENADTSTSVINPRAIGQFLLETSSVEVQPKKKDKNGNPAYGDPTNQGRNGEPDGSKVNPETLQMFGENVARRRAENKRLLEVVPDFNSIVKLVVAGAQSPNTLERGKFKFSFPGESKLPEIVRATVLRHVEGYAEAKYQYSNNLEKEIAEMLAKSGSVFKVILPPSKIQKIVRSSSNFSMESLVGVDKGLFNYVDNELIPESLGIFADPDSDKGFSMENLFDKNLAHSIDSPPKFKDFGENVDIKMIDNPIYLHNQEIEAAYAEQAIQEMYKSIYDEVDDADYSLEDNTSNRYVYKEGEKNTFRLPIRKIKFQGRDANDVLDVDSVEWEEEGEEHDTSYLNLMSPTVSNWPPESVIVCHRKGNPNQRLGYLGIIGKGGSPLTIEDDSAILRVRTDRAMRDSGTQNMLMRIRNDMYGSREERDSGRILAENHEEILNHFKYKMNSFLMKSLSNGVLGKTAEIVPTDEALLNMFYQALDEQSIRVVFIPERLCQHYAFEYDEYGMGKTMFDDGRLLFNMKAALVYAQTYAAITSARPIKDVTITIDPNSPDPKKEAIQRIEALLRAEHMAMPWVNISESNLERNTLLAGMNITFTGNDNLPQSNTEVKETSRQLNQIDRDITELIDDTCYKALGWTKEVANWFGDMDIATTVISNNLQVARRIQHIQNILIDLTQSFILKTLPIDGEFLGRVIADLMENKKEGVKYLKELGGKDTKDFYKALKKRMPTILREMTIELPRPDTSVINAKRRELDDFLSMLDAVLEGYINEDMFDDTEEMRNHIRSKKSIIRSGLIRWFNQSRDAIPELNALFDVDGESPLTEEHNEYLDKLGNAILKATKKLKATDIDFKHEIDDLVEDKEKKRQEELDKRNAESVEDEDDLVDNESIDQEEQDDNEGDAETTEEAEEEEAEAEIDPDEDKFE